MKFIFWVSVLVAIALLWSLWGRDLLKSMNWSWSNRFFAFIEPIEIRLWKNSKTIFLARLKMIIGILLTFGTQAQLIDITPLMPFVPDDWEPTVRVAWNLLPMLITGLGILDEKLRRETTEPLEVVATSEAVRAALPEVQKMENANEAAVVAVEEAKAEGRAG